MKKTEHVVYMSQILNHTRTVDVKLKDDIKKFPTKGTFKGWFLKKKNWKCDGRDVVIQTQRNLEFLREL